MLVHATTGAVVLCVLICTRASAPQAVPELSMVKLHAGAFPFDWNTWLKFRVMVPVLPGDPVPVVAMMTPRSEVLPVWMAQLGVVPPPVEKVQVGVKPVSVPETASVGAIRIVSVVGAALLMPVIVFVPLDSKTPVLVTSSPYVVPELAPRTQVLQVALSPVSTCKDIKFVAVPVDVKFTRFATLAPEVNIRTP
jgi:hypothetical protein